MENIAKKTIIVYVLKVLYNYTTNDNPATQTFIANYLRDIGILCDRKTVGRNIKYLIEIGVPIKKSSKTKNGFYYDIKNDDFLKTTQIKGEK